MSFEDSLSISVELEDEINEEARIVSFHLLQRLMIVSPVDTGRFRGNWFLSLGKSSREINQERRSGSALQEGKTVIDSATAIDYPTIILSNNLPYAEKLNNGHSLQAPKKFIEKEIDAVARKRNLNRG